VYSKQADVKFLISRRMFEISVEKGRKRPKSCRFPVLMELL